MKARYLLIVVVVMFAVSMLAPQSYAKIDPDSIVCSLSFDEGNGDKAKDSSANGKDGAIMGKPNWVDGKFGKALEYDGKDDYVLVHLGTALMSLTLDAWIYPTEGGVVFVEEGQAGLDASWYDSHMEILGSGEIKVGFWTGAEQGISLGKYSFEKWYNVVMTYDKSDNNISGYVNGELMESGSLTKQNPGDLWYAIGARTATNLGDGTHFNGIIDKVTIYNVGLSEADVKLNYQTANAVSPTDKLTATWASVKTE